MPTFPSVSVQLTTWTTGSAPASWREMEAHLQVHPVSPQPWVLCWVPLFSLPRMRWTGCLQEGRWRGTSDATHPALPKPVRTDNFGFFNASPWLGVQLLTDKRVGLALIPCCTHAKSLASGFHHTGYLHCACGAGCVVVVTSSQFILMHVIRMVPLCTVSARANCFLNI